MPVFGELTNPLIDSPGNATELRTPGFFNAMSDIFRITASVRSSVAPSGSCANATRYSLSCVGTNPGGTRENPARVRAISPTYTAMATNDTRSTRDTPVVYAPAARLKNELKRRKNQPRSQRRAQRQRVDRRDDRRDRDRQCELAIELP